MRHPASRREEDSSASRCLDYLMDPPTLERLGVILNPAATPLWKDGHVDMPSGTAMRSKLMVVFLEHQHKNK